MATYSGLDMVSRDNKGSLMVTLRTYTVSQDNKGVLMATYSGLDMVSHDNKGVLMVTLRT